MPQIWKTETQPKLMELIRPKALAKRWPQGEEAPKLLLEVREFVPRADDITSERWNSGGSEVVVWLPCYASDNHERTLKSLEHWVEQNFEYYARDMTSQYGDFLTSATFDQALRWAKVHPVS